jgi:hypothetical protein
LPLSYFRPVITSCPLVNGGIKLRRLISTGSSWSLWASTSSIRSSRNVASGRPAPRYASTGVVLV